MKKDDEWAEFYEMDRVRTNRRAYSRRILEPVVSMTLNESQLIGLANMQSARYGSALVEIYRTCVERSESAMHEAAVTKGHRPIARLRVAETQAKIAGFNIGFTARIDHKSC